MQTLNSITYLRFLENRVAPAPAVCPVHNLPMLATQSGLQQVCQILDCDEHVWLDGPRRRDAMKDPIIEAITNSTKNLKSDKTIAPAKVTLPAKADKAQRAKAVEEAVQAKKLTSKVEAPKPAKKEKDKPVKVEKPAKNPNVLSVSDVARELGVDPKRARARLRAAGLGAIEGRWQTVERGTPLFAEWSSIINPTDEEPEADEEEEGEDEE